MEVLEKLSQFGIGLQIRENSKVDERNVVFVSRTKLSEMLGSNSFNARWRKY